MSAVRDLATKNAATFADLAATFRLFGYPMAAKACVIAEKANRDVSLAPPENVEKVVDRAREALDAYANRFGRGGNYVGPIDPEMDALRVALAEVTP